jgi:hypothetical protein
MLNDARGRMWNLVSLKREPGPFVDALLPLLKQHSRIEHDLEDGLLQQYIAAGFDAAENYLGRDVITTEREYVGAARTFDYRRGLVRDLQIKDANGDPVAWSRDWRIAYMNHDKTPGLRIDMARYCTCPFGDDLAEWTGGDYTLTLAGGYESPEKVPADVRQFVLVAAAAMYEVRELANYTSTVQDADFLPLHLLAAWANLSYA